MNSTIFINELKMKYLFLLFLSCIICSVKSQGLNCRKDTIIDESNKVKYLFNTMDSTCSIKVTINKISFQKNGFYYDINECSFVPRFIMKDKNNFLFLSGTHQHYRLITIFQLKGENIIVDAFENDLTLESSSDGFEKLMYLDNGNPALVIIGIDKKSIIKTCKNRLMIDNKSIESYTIFADKIEINFKNNKIKTLMMKDFN